MDEESIGLIKISKPDKTTKTDVLSNKHDYELMKSFTNRNVNSL